MLSVPGRFF
jgi:hypothetical protein